MMMARVCVFDVNETLLDLSALDPYFEQSFGDAGMRQMWFSQMLQSAMVATVLGQYFNFHMIAGTSLDMVASRQGVTLSAAQRQQILAGMRTLPPHPEVRASLDRLRDAGVRLAALTNSSPPKMAEEQLTYAGLADCFERILSVEMARRLKPAVEVYHMAAHRLGVEPAGVRLVAAHWWDVVGAMEAGCAAAFVARPGMVLDPLFAPPDIVGTDLREVAEKILAQGG